MFLSPASSEDALQDLDDGFLFYEAQESGLGPQVPPPFRRGHERVFAVVRH
jgi:hypothetical protein